MFRFITHKPFWVNALAAIALFLLIIFGFFSSLDWITNHNVIKKIPTVVGLNVTAATALLSSEGFTASVQDSVYIDTTAKGTVIRQTPDPDAEVKSGRTVYLTINRTIAPLVVMPDLRGFSFLSAQLYLQSLGLKLGDTSYTPDIARNAVKDQLFKGSTIQSGTKINMGSTISLVLGDGVSDDLMDVPDLVGMSLSQAKQYLSTLNIGIGAVVADPAVSDTLNAFIYKQNPARLSPSAGGENMVNKISQGQVIDVYLGIAPPPRDTTNTNLPQQ